jgi:hypothetical protein
MNALLARKSLLKNEELTLLRFFNNIDEKKSTYKKTNFHNIEKLKTVDLLLFNKLKQIIENTNLEVANKYLQGYLEYNGFKNIDELLSLRKN